LRTDLFIFPPFFFRQISTSCVEQVNSSLTLNPASQQHFQPRKS
jgi:hypothetical protein